MSDFDPTGQNGTNWHPGLRESYIFDRNTIAEFRRAASQGIYDIRGFGAKRKLPHFDDLLFLGASMSRYPLEGYRERCGTEVTLGTRFAKKPIHLKIPITIAGMSFGALSGQAKEALGRGATMAGTSTTTGDGLRLPATRARISSRTAIQSMRKMPKSSSTMVSRAGPGAVVTISAPSSDGRNISTLRYVFSLLLSPVPRVAINLPVFSGMMQHCPQTAAGARAPLMGSTMPTRTARNDLLRSMYRRLMRNVWRKCCRNACTRIATFASGSKSSPRAPSVASRSPTTQ